MANPTTNYSWPMPTSADLVTDLPADFAAFGQPVDTSLKALNPETTLGDIAYRSSTSNTNTRLGIGSTGQVLTVASGVPAWATPATSGPAFLVYRTSNQSITANVATQVQFNAELFDTGSYFASNAFTPLVSGYYQINANLSYNSTTAGAEFQVRIYKNGVIYSQGTNSDLVSGFGGGAGSTIMYFNGTTDNATVFAYVSAGTITIQGSQDQCQFSGVWIRS